MIHLATSAQVLYDISFRVCVSSLSSTKCGDDMKLGGHILESDHSVNHSVDRMFLE